MFVQVLDNHITGFRATQGGGGRGALCNRHNVSGVLESNITFKNIMLV